ncbi:AraC family transcriptional regulator [Nibricoccus aquaticus]|uniref:AraC family transcriptional regulator n=1 Tax=Nibricoccus aquaticus TaxID=2576891 RepID=A0A290QMM5_9BACT|nr:helix-turn-helix domain-containing protein [Nibricoccus aquaticus]ATC65422.1 AraC family transcriptional regulator [Nibricoccus aquaticus]
MPAAIYPRLTAADDETWSDTRYIWDNSRRPLTDYCVVQRTLSGAVRFEMDGQAELAARGQALLFTHDEPSRYGFPAEATVPYRLRFIAFSPGALRPFFDELRSAFGSVVRMRDGGEAARLLDEIIARSHRHDFRDPYQVAEMLGRLLFSLRREQLSDRDPVDPIEYGRHLMDNDAGGRLGLKDIARLTGVSREYFIREYTRRHGCTPGGALRALRLEKARAMILATPLPLTEIAAASGFGSADALRRSFRRHFGENPLALRAPGR